MKIIESTGEEQDLIDSRLVAFNKMSVPFQQTKDWISLSHVLKNNEDQVVAGINATLYCWNVMYIDILYVDEVHRRKGYGRLLLDKAESKAKSMGGYMAHLDTFDWQAKDFYERHGYEIFGALNDCPPGHTRYYTSKRL